MKWSELFYGADLHMAYAGTISDKSGYTPYLHRRYSYRLLVKRVDYLCTHSQNLMLKES